VKTAKPKSSDAMLSECGHETQLLRAFTLIELLVVVAIIALLVAILVPTLNRAREEAKKVVCLSNLHQIGVAVHCYINDNSGRMPGYRDDLSDAPVG
jgi:prepilin-type N-terminal cleavage/methylation domain-containing protein